jgi:hypothetical protein
MVEPVFGFEYPAQAGRWLFTVALSGIHPKGSAGRGPRRARQKNPLMRHWFDGTPAAAGNLWCTAPFPRVSSPPEKISLANFLFRITL